MPYSYNHPRPALTTDIVLLRPAEGAPEVLLIRRRHAPFAGEWAIPGGFVDKGETLEDAARRELREETGLTDVAIQQLAAFGDPGRDPRGWVVSVAFWSWIEHEIAAAVAADDAEKAAWWPLDALPPLAFDHAEILQQALEALRRSRLLAGEEVTSLPYRIEMDVI